MKPLHVSSRRQPGLAGRARGPYAAASRCWSLATWPHSPERVVSTSDRREVFAELPVRAPYRLVQTQEKTS